MTKTWTYADNKGNQWTVILSQVGKTENWIYQVFRNQELAYNSFIEPNLEVIPTVEEVMNDFASAMVSVALGIVRYN